MHLQGGGCVDSGAGCRAVCRLALDVHSSAMRLIDQALLIRCRSVAARLWTWTVCTSVALATGLRSRTLTISPTISFTIAFWMTKEACTGGSTSICNHNQDAVKQIDDPSNSNVNMYDWVRGGGRGLEQRN